MTIGNAIQFINKGMNDTSLRRRLNASTTLSGLAAVLSDEKLLFSDLEFDEAFHYLLVKCQEKEDADRLSEFKFWWEFLSNSISPRQCSSNTQCHNCPT